MDWPDAPDTENGLRVAIVGPENHDTIAENLIEAEKEVEQMSQLNRVLVYLAISVIFYSALIVLFILSKSLWDFCMRKDVEWLKGEKRRNLRAGLGYKFLGEPI